MAAQLGLQSGYVKTMLQYGLPVVNRCVGTEDRAGGGSRRKGLRCPGQVGVQQIFKSDIPASHIMPAEVCACHTRSRMELTLANV